mgnify:CR=1 FL=1
MTPRNAPLFPVPRDEGMSGITPQEDGALNGPEGSFVSGAPGTFARKTDHAFGGKDSFKVDAPHPSQPINDADFPNPETVAPSTNKAAFDTGGLL